MQVELNEAQKNFNLYGLDFFVDGTKKPKK